MRSTEIITVVQLDDAIEESLDAGHFRNGICRVLVEIQIVAPCEARPEQVFEVGLAESLEGLLKVVEGSLLGFREGGIAGKQLQAVIAGAGIKAFRPSHREIVSGLVAAFIGEDVILGESEGISRISLGQ